MHDEGHTCILLNLSCKLAFVIEACSGQIAPPLIEFFAILFEHGACTSPASLEVCADYSQARDQVTITHTASAQRVLSYSFIVLHSLEAG